MPAHTRAAAALLAVGLPLTACSEATPLDVPGEEVRGGAVGPDADVTDDLGLRQVQLAWPADGVYTPGEDAELYLAVTNTGNRPAELVEVRGPDFDDAELPGDGTLTVDQQDTVYVGAEGAPSIVLEDLDRSLRSSQSIPVTFVFEDAGTVTVDVMVAAEGQEVRPFDFADPAEDPT
ncbi:copper chaperone PCu(A)C [Blastococcus sp. TML/M2B]|uniref:copper chaperone PCu(A)C n=1 Tax=unclassified Blastococcus TaxID=2619396 RepID=UPI00190CF22E|nr:MULTISPECIES: copper chaperone PCu(A)C [unclassified Blastococcus]MBN1091140.1 copper chaperone PCu(A)C [Blastococcus sp. TML/M2B]MBN1095308.1 copper chaperone PCu(A)C [Blastococcus sp. TML/C7B]